MSATTEIKMITAGEALEEAIKSLKFIRKAAVGKPTETEEAVSLVPVTVNGEDSIGIARIKDVGEALRFEIMWVALTPGMKVAAPEDLGVVEFVRKDKLN